jgi:ketosteroid isomerase-like protein
MTNTIISLLLIAAITKLSFTQSDIYSEIEKIKQTDIEFSNLSKEKGMKEAFLAYLDIYGTLLRPNMMPVVGYENVKKLLEEGDTDFTLTWEPLFGDVSSSLDLGYTYGTYTLNFNDKSGTPQTRRGTYVSIWKKQSDGKWKFVLDTGNPGLEPK